MPSFLITGSSRGIGLGMVAELLKNKNNVVFATARNTASSPGLQELKAKDVEGRLHLVDLDVTKHETVQKAAEIVSNKLTADNGLDHLISNAGINPAPDASFEDMDYDEFAEEVKFNITAPFWLIREFLPLVWRSSVKKILIISSNTGSIELAGHRPYLANAYSTGKAALNMMIRKWSAYLKNDGITTTLLHPGLILETDIGSGVKAWVEKYAPGAVNLTIEQSAADCIKVLHGITAENNGEFLNHDGTKIPW